MCGVCGIVRFDATGVGREEIQAMTGRLTHRGPDDEGIYLDGPVGLGHRRLAIIDLAHGQQPMANEDGRVWVGFNGMIYNYRALREELNRAGHRFAARDRMGEKPLYYAVQNRVFYFASEIKGLLAHIKAAPHIPEDFLVFENT